MIDEERKVARQTLTEAKKPGYKSDLAIRKKDEEIERLRNQVDQRNNFSKQFRIQIINKQQEIEQLTEDKMQFEEERAEYEAKILELEAELSEFQEKEAGPPPELIFQEEMVDLMMQLKEKELELQQVKSQMQNVTSSAEKIRNYEKAFQHVQTEMQKNGRVTANVSK